MKLFCFLFSLFLISTASAEKSAKEAYNLSCKACHGENGAGGIEFSQGPNLTILKQKYAKEQFDAIRSGQRKGPGTVNMLRVLKESKLSEKEIQAAFKYAMDLPRAGANHMKFGDVKKGKVKYSTLCIHCHGILGEGYSNPALPAPRLAGQADFYIVDMIKSFKAGHRDSNTAASQQMKAMSNVLVTDDDIKNVSAYIRTLDTFKPADLKNLTYEVFQGKWKKLPDFSKLKVVKSGSLATGLMSIKVAELSNNFAMRFTGQLQVPQDGTYIFQLASDDGSKLFINGKKVIDNDKLHPVVSKEGKIKLKKGLVSLTVTYFDGGGGKGFSFGWKLNKKKKKFAALSDDFKIAGKKAGVKRIPLEANKELGEALLFRNFIKGASARSIAVGYPERTHIVFDANNMNLAMMWTGKYLDAGAMWNNRGTSFMHAQGQAVAIDKQAQVAQLATAESQWPNLNRSVNQVRKSDLRFRGYSLDKKQYPTFMYSLKSIRFEDFFKPIDRNGSGMERTIVAKFGQDLTDLWFRVAVNHITQQGDIFTIDGKYKVKVNGGKLRQYGKIQELVIPFKFSNNQASIKIQYLFLGDK